MRINFAPENLALTTSEKAKVNVAVYPNVAIPTTTEQHVTCEVLEVVVGSEECPDLGVEAEDGSEGEQELQQAQEDVVHQVVVASPVLKISGMGEMKHEEEKNSE